MRANEFAVEGVGDWMQGQIHGRKQKDQARVSKLNLPKIVKAVNEMLVMKIQTLATRAKESSKPLAESDVTDAVVGTLAKALKIDPTTPDYNEMTREIIASGMNPEKFPKDISVVKNIEAMAEAAFAPGTEDKKTEHEIKAQVYKPATKKDVVITLIDDEYALLRKVAGADVYELKTEYKTQRTKDEIIQFIAKDGATDNKPANTGIFINSILTPVHTKLGKTVYRITPE